MIEVREELNTKTSTIKFILEMTRCRQCTGQLRVGPSDVNNKRISFHSDSTPLFETGAGTLLGNLKL